jgi:hypothetical protein
VAFNQTQEQKEGLGTYVSSNILLIIHVNKDKNRLGKISAI